MSDMDMDISLAWWLCDSTETKKKTGHPCRVRRTDCAWTWIDWTENCKVLFVHHFQPCVKLSSPQVRSPQMRVSRSIRNQKQELDLKYSPQNWQCHHFQVRTWFFFFSFLWCFLSVHNCFYFDFDLQFLAFCPSVFPKDLMKDFFTMHGISGERFLWGHKLLVQILSVKEYILGAFGRKRLRELLPVKGMVVSHHMPALPSLKR